MYELFLFKDAGQISIYSNPELKAETGYTAEIGYKHKWVLNESLKTYFDIAAFHMVYNDMVEYSYGLWGDSTRLNPLGVGFKPINVGQTKISGLDLSILSEGKLGKWDLYSRISYTYMIPRATKPDEIYGSYNDRLDAMIQNFIDQGLIDETLVPLLEQIAEAESQLSYNSTSSNPDSETLKYRYRHMAKLDIGITRGNWTIGTHLHYNSFMENIDKLFESGAFNAEVLDIFTLADANIYDMGIKKSRNKLKDGDLLADVRISYNFAEYFTIQALVENASNREYQIRPGSIGSPRTFSLKITSKF
jgi:outer membrane receptor protein involved in Fe transport